MSSLFPNNFCRSELEKFIPSDEAVVKFVYDSIMEQVHMAKKNKISKVLVSVSFPTNWVINTIICSKIMDEIIDRFQPIEIPWGDGSWKSIDSEGAMEICTALVRKFRFYLYLY